LRNPPPTERPNESEGHLITKHQFSQNKSKLGDSIAQRIPFEGEYHYLARSPSQAEDCRGRTFAENAQYSNTAFPLLIVAVLIILVGGCFAIVTSSRTTNTETRAEDLFYVD
jgi:uncharacterized ion transporter superfamily protein YfcC